MRRMVPRQVVFCALTHARKQAGTRHAAPTPPRSSRWWCCALLFPLSRQAASLVLSQKAVGCHPSRSNQSAATRPISIQVGRQVGGAGIYRPVSFPTGHTQPQPAGRSGSSRKKKNEAVTLMIYLPLPLSADQPAPETYGSQPVLVSGRRSQQRDKNERRWRSRVTSAASGNVDGRAREGRAAAAPQPVVRSSFPSSHSLTQPLKKFPDPCLSREAGPSEK
ncbi:hypothetical protein GGR56DRAFT_231706 [Xylariaceae sp. FL0804]|nr:hypothetical protein GGR56DRAFT_231706 [Xylariaceae sp. FL0804]